MAYLIDKFFPFNPNDKVNYSITATKYTKFRIWCIGCGGSGGTGGSKWGLYNAGGGGSGGNGGISVSEIELLENESIVFIYPYSYNGVNCAAALVSNKVIAAASNGNPGGNGTSASWRGGGDGGPGGPGGQAFEGNYINQNGTGGNRAGEPNGAGANPIYFTKFTTPKYTAEAHQNAYGDYEIPTLCFGTAGGGAEGNGGPGRGVGAKGAIIIERWIPEPKMLYGGKHIQKIMLGEYDMSTPTDKVIVPLDVTGDGLYEAPKGVDGYSPVRVNLVDSLVGQLLQGTATNISSNVPNIRSNALASCKSLVSINFPELTTVAERAFENCNKLKEVRLPKVSALKEGAFYGCSELVTITLPSVRDIGRNAFMSCIKLEKADFPIADSISGASIDMTYRLHTLILRKPDAICTLVSSGSTFNNSGIWKDTGFIYVPKSLIEQYKADRYWSLLASHFRAIEDYPEITEANMVKTEFYMARDDGVKLVRSYSNKGMMIENPEGVRYSEAIDPEEMHRTYVETDEPIPEASLISAQSTHVPDYMNI